MLGAKMERYLIVGLGNPGREYERNRHNAGFKLVDRLSEKWQIPFERMRYKAVYGQGKFLGKKIMLIKPQNFMNNSGLSVTSFMRFYKLSLDHLLILYDDVDLKFGTIRLRAAGSAAGHHGVESIIEKLGGSNFPRLRIGIGRPNGEQDVMDYVLENFNLKELEALDNILDKASKSVESYLIDGIEIAMSNFNGNVIND